MAAAPACCRPPRPAAAPRPRAPARRPALPPPCALPPVPSSPPPDDTSAMSRALLSFVQSVEASDVEHFATAAPPDVVDALQTTVGALVGTLPAGAFDVQINADVKDVGQLLQATLMSGYMMSNVASRLSLRSRLAPPRPPVPRPDASPAAAAAAVAAATAAGAYAPGAQTDGVAGAVVKWHPEAGAVRVEAAAYVPALEAELAAAAAALAGATAAATAAASSPSASTAAAVAGGGRGPNAVLGFLRAADAPTLAGLTADATPAVLEAGNAFVQRLVGSPQGGRRRWASGELKGLLFFAGVVGVLLRTLEARADLEASLLLPDGGDRV